MSNASEPVSPELAELTDGCTTCRLWAEQDAGLVEFATIYPGWYPGRTVHIHLMVHANDRVYTSQLYFPDPLSNQVLVAWPYAERPGRDTTNDTDEIFPTGGDPAVLDVPPERRPLAGRHLSHRAGRGDSIVVSGPSHRADLHDEYLGALGARLRTRRRLRRREAKRPRSILAETQRPEQRYNSPLSGHDPSCSVFAPASRRLPDHLPDPVEPGGTDGHFTARRKAESPVFARGNGMLRHRPERGSSIS